MVTSDKGRTLIIGLKEGVKWGHRPLQSDHHNMARDPVETQPTLLEQTALFCSPTGGLCGGSGGCGTPILGRAVQESL